jgi:hypothetical protein
MCHVALPFNSLCRRLQTLRRDATLRPSRQPDREFDCGSRLTEPPVLAQSEHGAGKMSLEQNGCFKPCPHPAGLH